MEGKSQRRWIRILSNIDQKYNDYEGGIKSNLYDQRLDLNDQSQDNTQRDQAPRESLNYSVEYPGIRSKEYAESPQRNPSENCFLPEPNNIVQKEVEKDDQKRVRLKFVKIQKTDRKQVQFHYSELLYEDRRIWKNIQKSELQKIFQGNSGTEFQSQMIHECVPDDHFRCQYCFKCLRWIYYSLQRPKPPFRVLYNSYDLIGAREGENYLQNFTEIRDLN